MLFLHFILLTTLLFLITNPKQNHQKTLKYQLNTMQKYTIVK